MILTTSVDEGVAAWVSQQSFDLRDLPRTLLRTLCTPPLLCSAAWLCIAMLLSLPMYALLLPLFFAIGWIMQSTTGETVGIGLYEDGTLIGGIRLKVHGRTMTIMGLYVDPAYRKHGGADQLIAATLQLAADRWEEGTITIFQPTHAASKHIRDKYLDGGKLHLGSDAFAASVRSLTV